MELRPFARDGRVLAVGAVVGYVAVLAAWIVLARFGQGEALSGAYAKGFTFLVLPPLLMIPAGLSLILGVLAMRCEGFDNEIALLRLGGLFAVVFCVAASAALMAFYATDTTVLYLQVHVLATGFFCIGLALGCGQLVRQVGLYAAAEQESATAMYGMGVE